MKKKDCTGKYALKIVFSFVIFSSLFYQAVPVWAATPQCDALKGQCRSYYFSSNCGDSFPNGAGSPQDCASLPSLPGTSWDCCTPADAPPADVPAAPPAAVVVTECKCKYEKLAGLITNETVVETIPLNGATNCTAAADLKWKLSPTVVKNYACVPVVPGPPAAVVAATPNKKCVSVKVAKTAGIGQLDLSGVGSCCMSAGDCTLDDILTTGAAFANLLTQLSAAFFFATFVYGGAMYLLSFGDKGRVDKGKKAITGAAIGMLIVLMAWTVVNYIANSLKGK